MFRIVFLYNTAILIDMFGLGVTARFAHRYLDVPIREGIIAALVLWALIEILFTGSPGELMIGIRFDSQIQIVKSVLKIGLKYFAVCTSVLLSVIGLGVFLSAPYLLILIFYICLTFMNLYVLAYIDSMFSVEYPDKFHSGYFLAIVALPLMVYPGLFEGGVWYLSPKESTLVSSVKANMYTLQTTVEIYGSEWDGHFPRSVETIKRVSLQNKETYWKDFSNPYSSLTGLGKSYANEFPIIPFRAEYLTVKNKPGMITYVSKPPYTHYTIYGYDKKGNKILDKGRVLFLTNG